MFIKFLLLFCKTYSFEKRLGHNQPKVTVKYKVLFGTTYVLPGKTLND